MVPRSREQLGGLLIAVIGGLLAAFNWHLALAEGHYYVKSGFAGPMFAVVGLALMIFPSPKRERADKGLPAVRGIQELTPRWWTVLVVALAAGVLNLYLLGHGLPGSG